MSGLGLVVIFVGAALVVLVRRIARFNASYTWIPLLKKGLRVATRVAYFVNVVGGLVLMYLGFRVVGA